MQSPNPYLTLKNMHNPNIFKNLIQSKLEGMRAKERLNYRIYQIILYAKVHVSILL